uniref:Uncharacterized protein n=1 Tax=Aegilops tauschii subsp. strangulata TaxID=200361 RepID=A0A453B6X9_AEGTS
MDIYSAVFVFCVYAVGTMEVQVLSAMALARRKAAPAPTASKLGRMLGSSLCVFVATYLLAHGTLSVLAPCHFQCLRVRIAALVAGVVDLAVTASIMPVCSCSARVGLLLDLKLGFSFQMPYVPTLFLLDLISVPWKVSCMHAARVHVPEEDGSGESRIGLKLACLIVYTLNNKGMRCVVCYIVSLC